MQSDVAVGTNAITGTLAFIEGGLSPAGYLSGDGHFLALKFSTADWADFDRVEVGLDPSQGSGLVDLLPDPDKNGVFKITSTSQKFIVKTTIGEDVVTKEYSLADLVLSPEPTPAVNPEAIFRIAVDGGQTSVNILTQDDVTTYSGSFDGDYSNEGMMIRVQHDDADKPFTLTSYKINNTPITLTQGETGDYSAFLTGPNVPDPTNGYEVEIVLELDSVEYTYTLNVTYASQPTPTAADPALKRVSASGIQSVTPVAGTYIYTSTHENSEDFGAFNVTTVADDVLVSAVRINSQSIEVPTPTQVQTGGKKYTCFLPAGTDKSQDVTLEVVTEQSVGGMTYTLSYFITYTLGE